MKDRTCREGKKPLLCKSQPLDGARPVSEFHANESLERRLQGVDFEAVFEGAQGLRAARRRMRPIAPSNRLPVKSRGFEDRELGYQTVRISLEISPADQQMNSRSSIVVP